MKLERIAYVLKIFPKISETFIAEELAELRRRGVQVRILSLEPPRREPRHDLVAGAGLEPITCYEPNNFLAALKAFRPQLLNLSSSPTLSAWAMRRPWSSIRCGQEMKTWYS